MATAQCPACGLVVPYFCCEGLVCPACGYDEEQSILPDRNNAQSKGLQVSSREPPTSDAHAPHPSVQ
jgi:uncharacterized Zn finger protein (UPF0148 family)